MTQEYNISKNHRYFPFTRVSYRVMIFEKTGWGYLKVTIFAGTNV